MSPNTVDNSLGAKPPQPSSSKTGLKLTLGPCKLWGVHTIETKDFIRICNRSSWIEHIARYCKIPSGNLTSYSY